MIKLFVSFCLISLISTSLSADHDIPELGTFRTCTYYESETNISWESPPSDTPIFIEDWREKIPFALLKNEDAWEKLTKIPTGTSGARHMEYKGDYSKILLECQYIRDENQNSEDDDNIEGCDHDNHDFFPHHKKSHYKCLLRIHRFKKTTEANVYGQCVFEGY